MAEQKHSGDDDGIGWSGPLCPNCGVELDVEPTATGKAIFVSYSCREHGSISIADPFDGSLT